MKKKIGIVVLCLILIVSMCSCSKKCAGGCGNNASSDCGAGMCDDCCAYYGGFNGCRHTQFE